MDLARRRIENKPQVWCKPANRMGRDYGYSAKDVITSAEGAVECGTQGTGREAFRPRAEIATCSALSPPLPVAASSKPSIGSRRR